MKKNIVGIIYAIVHFSVEVASFYLLFSRISTGADWWGMALLFDALAFIPQSVFGVISDKYPKINMGFLGCILMISALIIRNNTVSLILIATGNALIHVHGAQHTLRNTDGKITPNAVFIGAGSFGVITGQLLGKSDFSAGIFIPLVLFRSEILQFPDVLDISAWYLETPPVSSTSTLSGSRPMVIAVDAYSSLLPACSPLVKVNFMIYDLLSDLSLHIRTI